MTVLSVAIVAFLGGALFGAGLTLVTPPRNKPVQDTRQGNEGPHMSEYHVCMRLDHGHYGIDQLRSLPGSPDQNQLPTA